MNYKDLMEANRSMLGRTNRAVLFATVNGYKFLRPNRDGEGIPESDGKARETPSLKNILSKIETLKGQAFYNMVKKELEVTSFKEFIDKFEPGFFYCIQKASGGPAGSLGAVIKFSTEGGPGLKKVRLNSNHPYVKCLLALIPQRSRGQQALYRIDIDDSMFDIKPREQLNTQSALLQDLVAQEEALRSAEKVAKLKYPSPPVGSFGKDDWMQDEAYKTAKASWGRARRAMEEAIEDPMRQLPVLIGTSRKILSDLLNSPAASETGLQQNLLLGFSEEKSITALPAGDEMESGEQSTELVVRPTAYQAIATIAGQVEATSLTKYRESATPQEKSDLSIAYLVSKMSKDSKKREARVSREYGALIATALSNPQRLVRLAPQIQSFQNYHDDFLSVYGDATRSFLQVVRPILETILGVYIFFREFEGEGVRSSGPGPKPALLVANAELSDLMDSQTQAANLRRFFELACDDPNGRYQSAIAYAIVPHVAPFQADGSRDLDDDDADLPPEAAEDETDTPDENRAAPGAAETEDSDDGAPAPSAPPSIAGQQSYNRVVNFRQLSPLLEWGNELGFMTLFCPQAYTQSGTPASHYRALAAKYGDSGFIDDDLSKSAVCCVPDFVVLPDGGKLTVGLYIDGKKKEVDVPPLVVRSCYAAAGRLVANDLPQYLSARAQKQKLRSEDVVLPGVPGVSVNTDGTFAWAGYANVPLDYTSIAEESGYLESNDCPFLAFRHVLGLQPLLVRPRTMHRENLGNTTRFVPISYFRESVYLARLINVANVINPTQFSPDPDTAAQQMLDLLNNFKSFSGYYDVKKANSFPGPLKSVGASFVVDVDKDTDGNLIFAIDLMRDVLVSTIKVKIG